MEKIQMLKCLIFFCYAITFLLAEKDDEPPQDVILYNQTVSVELLNFKVSSPLGSRHRRVVPVFALVAAVATVASVLSKLLESGAFTPTECRSEFNKRMLEQLSAHGCVTGVTVSEAKNAKSCSYGNTAILTKVQCGFAYKYKYVIYQHKWEERSVFYYNGARGYNMWGFANCIKCGDTEARAGLACDDTRMNTCKKFSDVAVDFDNSK